jgi:HAMP domain-containing protein
LLALLLSAGITLLLARRIIRPLSAAATIADRIAGGELETPIPTGGKDETGILLRSMTVMQDNIRSMMERETTQRRSAQNRLIDALESSREGMVLGRRGLPHGRGFSLSRPCLRDAHSGVEMPVVPAVVIPSVFTLLLVVCDHRVGRVYVR